MSIESNIGNTAAPYACEWREVDIALWKSRIPVKLALLLQSKSKFFDVSDFELIHSMEICSQRLLIW